MPHAAHTRLLRPSVQAGLTLIETVVVLGIVALVIAAVWVVAGAVTENARQYNFASQMQQSVQNIRQLYQRVNVVGDSDLVQLQDVLDQQEAFPFAMRANPGVAGGILLHPWSGDTTNKLQVRTYANAAGGGAAVQGFGLRYSGLPRQACITSVVKLSGGEVAGLVRVVVNSATTMVLPATAVAASTACNNATTNTVEWFFTLRN